MRSNGPLPPSEDEEVLPMVSMSAHIQREDHCLSLSLLTAELLGFKVSLSSIGRLSSHLGRGGLGHAVGGSEPVSRLSEGHAMTCIMVCYLSRPGIT